MTLCIYNTAPLDKTPESASTSIWVVANLDDADGVRLVQTALEAAVSPPSHSYRSMKHKMTNVYHSRLLIQRCE